MQESFEQKIQEALKAAMRQKDQAALRALRAVKSAILLAKSEAGAPDVISEEQGLKLVQKLVKQRKESIEVYSTQGRPELAKDEQEELNTLDTFLPKQLSPEELEALVKSVIADTGASSKKEIGKVMGEAIKRAAGQADGKAISSLAAKLLS